MGIFPSTMLETTIITPIEDFPKVSVCLAESEKFMPKEILSIEELENYYPETKLERGYDYGYDPWG